MARSKTRPVDYQMEGARAGRLYANKKALEAVNKILANADCPGAGMHEHYTDGFFAAVQAMHDYLKDEIVAQA